MSGLLLLLPPEPVMADLEISIEIVCSGCGRTLLSDDIDDRHGFFSVKVDPCETCLDKAAKNAAEET